MDHLQFGPLKVQQSKTLSCTLKNKGKFPVNYKISFDSKIFQVSPADGSLSPSDKPSQINFTFKASKVVNYTNSKGVTLTITDPLTNTVTSSLPLPFSCETMYSAFSISPGKLIDFGPLPISTTVTKQIILKNEGRFAFDFEVNGQADEPLQTPLNSGSNTIPNTTSKGKNKLHHRSRKRRKVSVISLLEIM